MKRLEMKMPDESWARLDALKAKTEGASYADVIRSALRLYEWIVGEMENGTDFGMRKAGGQFEVVHIFVPR